MMIYTLLTKITVRRRAQSVISCQRQRRWDGVMKECVKRLNRSAAYLSNDLNTCEICEPRPPRG